jgi:hypothetical protein
MTKTAYLKIVLIISFLILTTRAPAPGSAFLYIRISDSFVPYEKLIYAIVQVESLRDTMAYNIPEEATGAFQIRPIRLLDYNQRTGKNYLINDCYNYRISKEIFLYYAILTGFTDFESIARNWNGSGITTLDYWKKVKKYL